MKSRVAILSAALLLGSLGSALMVQPAVAQPAWSRGGGGQIERFTLRTDGRRIEPGAQLRFRLEGTPGGEAWVDVPGVISGLDLDEVRPGLYEGAYTVRRRDDPDAFGRAQATLRHGRNQATAYVDTRDEGDRDWGRGRDEQPPQFGALVPKQGERIPEGRAQVSARFGDDRSGVDPRSVRLRISGRDVTGESRIGDNGIEWRGDLRPGHYVAELSLRDRAGNAASRSWNFDVVPRGVAPVPVAPPVAVPAPQRPPQLVPQPLPAPGPLSLVITSHPNNAIVPANENVRLEGQTAPRANVRVQADTLPAPNAPALQKVIDLTVQADETGHFAVDFSPSGYVIPGVRYDVRVTAGGPGRAIEQRLTLLRRQN